MSTAAEHTLSGIAGTLCGGETWDDVELCEPFVLGSPSNRESFSPSAFQLGEKVPKADEGAVHEDVIRTPSSALGPASVNRAYLVKRPLIRLRHLLPPQETAGGEGLSTKGVARLARDQFK